MQNRNSLKMPRPCCICCQSCAARPPVEKAGDIAAIWISDFADICGGRVGVDVAGDVSRRHLSAGSDDAHVQEQRPCSRIEARRRIFWLLLWARRLAGRRQGLCMVLLRQQRQKAVIAHVVHIHQADFQHCTASCGPSRPATCRRHRQCWWCHDVKHVARELLEAAAFAT